MPILKRQRSVTGFYHVIVKGINNEKIFNQTREKVYFKSIILKHYSKYQIEIYSYCIMSNHAHFIIRAELSVLSRYMAIILGEYASYYNYKHNRNGHVFQNRFKSECIEDEYYFWTCLRYIHQNPVKAYMVKKAEKYKYSSMNEYISGVTDLLSKEAIGLMHQKFGCTEEFRQFHMERQKVPVEDISVEMKKQQEELAFTIAEMMQEEYKLTLVKSVIEEKEIREVYKGRLQTVLGVSKRRSDELCSIIKSKLKDT